MQGIRTRLLLKISRVAILRGEGPGSGGCRVSFSANRMIAVAVSEPRPPRRKAALRSYHWYATPPTKAPMAPPDAVEAAMRPSEVPLLSTPAGGGPSQEDLRDVSREDEKETESCVGK